MIKILSVIVLSAAFYTSSCKNKSEESELERAIGTGIRSEAGWFLGGGVWIVAVGGDRKSLVAIKSNNLQFGISWGIAKVIWNTKSGKETIAGQYVLERSPSRGLNASDMPGGTVVEGVETSRLEYFRRKGDGLEMFVATMGVGVSMLEKSELLVFSLGIPVTSPPEKVREEIERWDPNFDNMR